MSLSANLQDLLSTSGPPDLGPGPRAGVTSIAQIEAALAGESIPGPRRNLVRAAMLLWHDHIEAAHVLVQDLENADGSYIHAILHRREPDYGNAKYWFRRVGRHACFPELARRVAAQLDPVADSHLQSSLLPENQWDAFSFVDLCETVAAGRQAAVAERLRGIQQIEFEVLLERLLAAN